MVEAITILPSEITPIKEPPLSPERDKFRAETAYAFNRGISLLAINTLRQLREWGGYGYITVKPLTTVDGEQGVVYESTSKAQLGYDFRAVIVPDNNGVASRITIEKRIGKGRRKEFFEIQLGDSPSYRKATEYTGVNGERVTELWEYKYSDYEGKVSARCRRVIPLTQQQRGRPPFRFGEVEIKYVQQQNFLEAQDLEITFGNRLEPIEDAFIDLVKPHALRTAERLAREVVGKPQPRVFRDVRLLEESGVRERIVFAHDRNTHKFQAPGKPQPSLAGDWINIGKSEKGVSISATIKEGGKFIVRPFDCFTVKPGEEFTGSRTFVETSLTPTSISADSTSGEYVVPQKVIGR